MASYGIAVIKVMKYVLHTKKNISKGIFASKRIIELDVD